MVNIPGTDRIFPRRPLAPHETQSFSADPVFRSVASAGLRLRGLLLGCLALLFTGTHAHAQQFNSDNQWTAPHGVSTLIATAGQEYSAVLAVAALFPDWEFNAGVTRYYGDLESQTDQHNTGIRALGKLCADGLVYNALEQANDTQVEVNRRLAVDQGEGLDLLVPMSEAIN